MAQKERTKRAFGDMIMGRWYAESWKYLNFNCFKMFALLAFGKNTAMMVEVATNTAENHKQATKP